MEHEEIDLNQKKNNPRQQNGRFGVKTNKTLKYDRGAYRKGREKESITIIDSNDQTSLRYGSGLDLGVGISLNAHKNWEILNKNPLRSSQDDIEVEYGRVVDLEFDARLNKEAQRAELYRKIYGTNRGENTENNNNEDNDENSEPEYVSGTNRKGHFVKQKRKPGKKGVKSHSNTNNNGDNNGNNNNNTKGEDKSKRRSRTGSESDSEEFEPNSKIVLIQRHNPNTNMHLEQYPTSWSYRCTCSQCTGVVDNKQRRMQTHRDIEALDLSVL